MRGHHAAPRQNHAAPRDKIIIHFTHRIILKRLLTTEDTEDTKYFHSFRHNMRISKNHHDSVGTRFCASETTINSNQSLSKGIRPIGNEKHDMDLASNLGIGLQSIAYRPRRAHEFDIYIWGFGG